MTLSDPLQIAIASDKPTEPILPEKNRDKAFQYLESLGLIVRVEGGAGVHYRLTQAGLEFLEKYPGIEVELLQEKGLAGVQEMFLEWPTVRGISNPKVTVLIPTMNEAETIGELIERFPRYLNGGHQVLVVDASKDATPWVAMIEGARVIRQYGGGKGNAIRQILPAIESNIVLLMDGDGSMRPEEIPTFVQAVEAGADVVKGSRFLRGAGSQDLSLIRKIGNLLFVNLVNLLWSVKYTDLCYGFVAFRKEALEKLGPYLKSDRFQIETEICIRAKKLGLKVVEIPSIELIRRHGESKLSGVRDSLQILRVIMKEFVSRA